MLSQDVGYTRELQFDSEPLALAEDVMLQMQPSQLRAIRTPQGIYFEGQLQGTLSVECARCLEQFPLLLSAGFADLYVYPATSEAELSIDDAINIDLAPLVRQLFWLDVPYRPLCRPDCKGLCQECGENLNHHTNHQHEPPVNPRLAGLKRFLDG